MTKVPHTLICENEQELKQWLEQNNFYTTPSTNGPGVMRFAGKNNRRTALVYPMKDRFHIHPEGIPIDMKSGVVTDADRRCEPPPRTSTRGRKPKPLFYKLIDHITVVGYPNWNWEIPNYSLVPSEQWPSPLHQPWQWKGAQIGGQNRIKYVKHGPSVYPEFVRDKKYPVVKHQGTQYSPTRLMYELMIGDIPAGYKLRLKGRSQAYPMNVNPSHYEPAQEKHRAAYNFTLMDFEPDTDTPEAKTEQEANYSMSSSDIADFADLVEERMAQQRIPTYQDFLNEFEMDLFDATEDDIRAILKTAGLLERYGFS